MNNKDLKKIIKRYVKECVNEILAEKFLTEMARPRNEVRHASRQNLNDIFMPEVRDEDIAQARQQQKVKKSKPKVNANERDHLIRKLGINNSVMESVFRDTYVNGGDKNLDADVDPAGTISEKAMKDIGIMDHNWEAYIK